MAFSIDKIQTKALIKPPLVLLYSPNGYGKTTFIASSGNPFIIDTEDKCNHLDFARFVPSGYDDLIECLEHLYTQEALPYSALVVDTLDWVEKQIKDNICKTYGVKTIVDDKCKDLNFGKGNILAANMFLSGVLPGLEAIRKKHNIPVILCAQSERVKRKALDKDVEFEVMDLRLDKNFAKLLSDKVEVKMFLNRRHHKDHKGNWIPAKERYLVTDEVMGIDAKNNLNLSDEIIVGEETGWQDFINAIGKNKTK